MRGYGASEGNRFFVDIRGELPRVQAPTLVVHGAQDRMEPAAGARARCTMR